MIPSPRTAEAVPGEPIRLPGSPVGPTWSVIRRLLLALAIMLAAVLVTYASRSGYRDANGDGVSLLDSFYYATVSLSTTGYGDIAPATDEARLMNVLVITPLRVLFLIVLVGTTLEALTERSRAARRVERWRKRVRDHTVIIGFGTKGRSAARTLILNGTPASDITVIDPSADMIEEANRLGLTGIVGDATRTEVQERAAVGRAAHIIVAASRDDTAVLATLTARTLNPDATLISSVREAENADLLQQSGADSVVVSAEAAGRLLGLASSSPAIGEVMQDLLVQGSGLDVGERKPTPEEVGRRHADLDDLVLGVVRDGEVRLPSDAGLGVLRADDCLVYVRVNGPRRRA